MYSQQGLQKHLKPSGALQAVMCCQAVQRQKPMLLWCKQMCACSRELVLIPWWPLSAVLLPCTGSPPCKQPGPLHSHPPAGGDDVAAVILHNRF